MAANAPDFSAFQNPFQSNTPLMQDPTAQQPNVLTQSLPQGGPNIAPMAPDPSAGDPVAAAAASSEAQQQKAENMEVGALTQAAKEEKTAVEDLSGQLKKQTADAVGNINTMAADLQARSAEREKTDAQIEAQQREKAEALKTYESKVEEWAHSTPTHQAVAATAMHLAGPLSLLTALGGAMTRQSGLAMMGALNGVVEGIQSGSDAQYEDAMNKWNAAYKGMMDKERFQQEVYDTMLDAYKGRADAQEKAIERTRAITNDKLQANQMQMGTDLQLFNAKKGVIDAVANRNIAMAKVQEARAARAAKASADQQMTQDAIYMAARQYLNGAKLSDVAPPSRGGGYKAAVLNMATQIFQQDHASDPKYQGEGGHQRMLDDVSQLQTSARMELTGQAQALRTANVMAARVNWAEGEILNMAPIAKAANAKVMGRIDFVPYNKLYEQGLATISDPDMQRFASYTNTILNAYNVLSARGGTDMNLRERNLNMLATASSVETYNTALDAMITEIQAAKAAGLSATRLSAYRPPLAGEENIENRGWNKSLPKPWEPLQTDPNANPSGGDGAAPSVSNW